MAYGMDEENIAQYLIEHGADQKAVHNYGKDYQNKKSCYTMLSKYYFQKRAICKKFGLETLHFHKLCIEGTAE